MEKSKSELESLVISQKEQLIRYEKRLKDTIAAYKSILKEKEALEKSAHPKPSSSQENNSSRLGSHDVTVSSEKPKTETQNQADDKKLRQEMKIKDKMIKDMQDKLKQVSIKYQAELDSWKSLLITEKYDRDKQTQGQLYKLKELQKQLSNERLLNKNLEAQLDDLKAQFGTSDVLAKSTELKYELEETKRQLQQQEESAHLPRENTKLMLKQLHEEIQLMKQQHAIAIGNEQKRVLFAEETNRKLAALHEERVTSLEERLAELSSTVGIYDRQRQEDQACIVKLKEKIAQCHHEEEVEEKKTESVNEILEKILALKRKLVIENANTNNPIDVNSIFVPSNHQKSSNDSIDLSDYNKLKSEYNRLLEDCKLAQYKIEEQKVHIKTLQEKVKILNRNIEEQESEIKGKQNEFNQFLKAEKNKWRLQLQYIEAEYRSKLTQLENELQQQRERSLQLLNEKETEIKTLKTSFKIFSKPQLNTGTMEGDQDETNAKSIANQLDNVLNVSHSSSNGGTETESFHLLHFTHELARKDVEISNLRKAKHSAESSLRQALLEKVTLQEKLQDNISNLEDEVDRLKRFHSREGANLEYLKNVILSYLSAKDPDSRKHMLNAIGAVLKFTPTEMKNITTFLSGKK